MSFQSLRRALLCCGVLMWSFFCGSQTARANSVPGQGSLRSSKSMDDMKYSYEMSVDLAAMYIRQTQAGGSSDTGGRLSLGGMFTSWIGLDAMGLYELKSRSYLVGGDLRIVPINWFYVKAGAGGYFDKESRGLKATPLFGTGLKGYFTPYYYLVAEGLSYTDPSGSRSVSFGLGFGTIF